MNNPKDDLNNKGNGEEWEFNAIATKAKPELEAGRVVGSQKNNKIAKKEPALTLNEAALPKTKTRSAMAQDLNSDKEAELTDVYAYAPVAKRAFAFIIDTFFLAGMLFLMKGAAPFWRKIIQYFLDQYKLQLIIPEAVVMKSLVIGGSFAAVFFLIVIPVAFFNHSFGKKLMGLKIRGEEHYTLTISQAFSRELILKPISVLILAGFITPFFNKKKLSIHDMVGHTFVIEE